MARASSVESSSAETQRRLESGGCGKGSDGVAEPAQAFERGTGAKGGLEVFRVGAEDRGVVLEGGGVVS